MSSSSDMLGGRGFPSDRPHVEALCDTPAQVDNILLETQLLVLICSFCQWSPVMFSLLFLRANAAHESQVDCDVFKASG